MIVFAIALSFAGFTGLSLAMARHHEAMFGKAAASPWRLKLCRATGWACLLLALAVCVTVEGWGHGLVAMIGAMTIAALTLVLWLWPYHPKVILPLAAAAVPSTALLFALSL